MTKIPVEMFITDDETEDGFVDLVASYSGIQFTVVRIRKRWLDTKSRFVVICIDGPKPKSGDHDHQT